MLMQCLPKAELSRGNLFDSATRRATVEDSARLCEMSGCCLSRCLESLRQRPQSMRRTSCPLLQRMLMMRRLLPGEPHALILVPLLALL